MHQIYSNYTMSSLQHSVWALLLGEEYPEFGI